MQRVRVDGLLLIGVEGHLLCGGERGVRGLRLEVLDDGGGVRDAVSGHAGGGCSRVSGGDVGGSRGGVGGFGVGSGRFRVGRLALGDGAQTFALLGELALDEGHGMAGGQQDHCSNTQNPVRQPEDNMETTQFYCLFFKRPPSRIGSFAVVPLRQQQHCTLVKGRSNTPMLSLIYSPGSQHCLTLCLCSGVSVLLCHHQWTGL